MKRIIWTTAHLSAIGLLILAPLLPAWGGAFPKGLQMASDSTPMIQSVQAADELFLLNNDPYFPGGPKALEAYFNNPDGYPPAALEAHMKGTVRVRFRVQPDGKLAHITVLESKGKILDQAARELIANMPPWFPAHRAGVAVPAYHQLLVTFRLNRSSF